MVGKQFVTKFTDSGLNVSGSDENKEDVFNEMLYINFWFYGFTAIGLILLLSPLVYVWLGSGYLLEAPAVISACVYYFISSVHYPCYAYRTTAGLFVFGKYVPFLAAVCNIILDFIMGFYWGLVGILWASTISRIVTYEIVDPILVYKRVFHKSPLQYFYKYILYILLVIGDGLINYIIVHFIKVEGLLGIIIQAITITVVFNGIFLLGTYKTKSLKSIYKRIRTIIANKFNNVVKG